MFNFYLSLSLQSTVSNASKTAGKGTYTYTVKSGDSLWGIARSYGITVSELQKTNGLTSDFIRIGQKLKFPSSNRATASSPAAPASNGTYLVKSGDSLSVIGARFHYPLHS